MFKDINHFTFNSAEKDITSLYEKVLGYIHNTAMSFYANPCSNLYIPDFNIHTLSFHKFFVDKIASKETLIMTNIPEDCRINQALCWYIFHFAMVCNYDLYLKIIVKFCVLLHYFLEMRGWEFVHIYKKFKIINFPISGSFTNTFKCDFIPDMINEFIEVFIKLEEEFYIEEENLLDIANNLCNWLFLNNLTSFKSIRNEDIIP
jgi:hypothetical protein